MEVINETLKLVFAFLLGLISRKSIKRWFTKHEQWHPLFVDLGNHICFLLRLPVVFGLSSLTIEVTNRCNLKCKHCYNTIMSRRKQDIDYELFCSIIDKTKVRRIGLSNWGEPLLHPRIFDMIKYAVDKGKAVSMTTNGVLLDRTNRRKILDSGLSLLCISMDGVGQIYQEIRGFSYSFVRDNIMSLVIERGLLPLRIELAITKSNYVLDEDLAFFISEWKNRVDHIRVQQHVTFSENYLRLKRCKYLWDGCYVLSSGAVVACCVDYDGKLVMADRFDNNVMNNNRFKRLRSNQSRGSYCSPCLHCEALL